MEDGKKERAKDPRRGRYSNAKYLKNREKILEKSKEYYKNNREAVLLRSRKAYLKRKYNLDPDQFLDMCIAQGNLCAICGKQETRKTPAGDTLPLSVDHNHKTGQVRKLLCNDCNSLLGFCKEDERILINALQYLQDFN